MQRRRIHKHFSPRSSWRVLCVDASQVRPQKNSAPKLMAYVTPKKDDWPPELRALRTRKDFDALSIIHLNAEYTVVRGGRAPVTNLKKRTVVRARWIDFDVEHRLATDAQRTAFRWLMANNDVYAFYVRDFRSYLGHPTGKTVHVICCDYHGIALVFIGFDACG